MFGLQKKTCALVYPGVKDEESDVFVHRKDLNLLRVKYNASYCFKEAPTMDHL